MLTTPSQQTDIKLLALTQSIAAHLSAAANLANKQTQTILSLDNATLSGWLASHAANLSELLTAHAQTGTAINSALSQAQSTLQASGASAEVTAVDIRPLADKLDSQGRQIDLANLTVTDKPLPPQDNE